MNDEDVVLAVNAAYYRALATADVKAIERLWAFDGLTCVHPGWRPLIGREDVIASYRDILAGADSMPIICSGETAILNGDFARVLCMERVVNVVLVATNAFVRTPQGWLMAHHQASQVVVMENVHVSERDARPRTLN